MSQSTLSDFESSEKIPCPKGCGEYEWLSSHWSRAHDEPFPKNLPKMAGGLKTRLSETQTGKTLSKETRRKMSESRMGHEVGEATRRKIAETHMGMAHSEETKRKIGKSSAGRTHSEETKKKLSGIMSRKMTPEKVQKRLFASFAGQTHSEESIQKMVKSSSGKTLSEEHKQNISESLKGVAVPTPPGKICVIPTRHEVLSGWERDIDLLLHDNGHDHEYEPEAFDVNGIFRYTPDFRIGDVVVEVKGRVWDSDIQRAARFMRAYPEYQYIVVGSELPADVWIPWEERERLMDVLD